MDENIKVSIICITYNHEKFIKDALEGFLMQKINFKYEILIHDDASTDNTANIIKEYEKKYPNLLKVTYQKENQYSKGKMPTVYLLGKAKGEYIAFCEGDDYWIDENKLQRQIDFLEKNKEYYATYHNVLIVDENKKERKKLNNFYISHDVTLKDLENTNRLCGQTSGIVCRNFWKEFSEEDKKAYIDTKVNGDIKLSLLFVLKGKVYFFKQIMSCYRLTFNTDSWNSKNADNSSLDLIAYEKNNDLEKMIEKILKIKINYSPYPIIKISFYRVIFNFSFINLKNFLLLVYKLDNKSQILGKLFLDFVNRILFKLRLKKKISYWKNLTKEECLLD